MNTIVFVVMGNDYPDAVFSTHEAAEAHCELKRADDRKLIEQGVRHSAWPGIHWRICDFALDAARTKQSAEDR